MVGLPGNSRRYPAADMSKESLNDNAPGRAFQEAGSRRESWGFPHKVIVLESEPLYKELHRYQWQYAPTISCWRDQTLLHLEEAPVEWEIGYFTFAFGPVPVYKCGTCRDTHFPAHVLQTLSQSVDTRLQQLDTTPRFYNPNRIPARP